MLLVFWRQDDTEMQVLTLYFYEMSCFTDSKYSQREGGKERNRGPDNQQELYQANRSQEWHHLSRASRETHKIPAQTHRLRQSGWIRSRGQGKWLTLVDLWPPMMTVTFSVVFFFLNQGQYDLRVHVACPYFPLALISKHDHKLTVKI